MTTMDEPVGGSVFGLPISAVRAHVGSLGQVRRIDRFVEEDGTARGARRMRVVTGSGLEYEVHPDRALDIGRVTFDGVPMAWLSPTGFAAPGLAEAAGDGWTRTFGGGLMASCGFDNFGPAGIDGTTAYGLHGRIGSLPAELSRVEAGSESIRIEGTVRQATAFGENLQLERKISSAVGGSSILVEDLITNDSSQDAPLMALYHVNVGWPMLSPDAILRIPAATTIARDEDASAGLEESALITAPSARYPEQVFQHTLAEECDTVRLTNPVLGIEFSLRFSSDTLPWINQWKLLKNSTYVLGIEPTNCRSFLGRVGARDAGELPILRAGESVLHRLEFGFRRLD
jgi:hypothetical protein